MALRNYFFDDGKSVPWYSIVSPAATYAAEVERTYIGYQGPDLNPYILFYDHKGEFFSDAVQIGSNPLTDDDHGPPAIVRTSDGTIHATWGSHGLGWQLQYAQTQNPDDISSWTTQEGIAADVTYQNMRVLPNDNIYIFHRKTLDNRGGSLQDPLHWTWSTDGGSTWSTQDLIADFGDQHRLYPSRPRMDGDKAHIMWVDRDGNRNGELVENYHAIHDPTTNTLTDIDGNDLGTDITEAEADSNCLVFDPGSEQSDVPLFDLDDSNTPHVLLTHNNGGTWEWRYTTYDGTGWTSPLTVTTKGNSLDIGEMVVNTASDITAYLQAEASTRARSIEEWHYDGSTWSFVQTTIDQADWSIGFTNPTQGTPPNPDFDVMAVQPDTSDFTNSDLKAAAVDETTYLQDGFSEVAAVDATVSGVTQTTNGVIQTTTTTTAPSGPTVVDSFEDQNITEYSGDTGQFTTVASPTTDGSYALEGQENGSAFYKTFSTTGLNAYPSAGDTYRVDTQMADAGSRAILLFGVQDTDSYYLMDCRADNNDLVIGIIDNGSYTEFDANTSVPFSSNLNTYFPATIDWNSGGGFTADVELGGTTYSVSTTNSTFTSGGVGFRVFNATGGSGTSYYDYARIVSTE